MELTQKTLTERLKKMFFTKPEQKQVALPPHLPYIPWMPRVGKRRSTTTRVNMTRWKCQRTKKHLYDIVQTMEGGKEATVRCRRCGKIDIVPVRMKQYTSNKKVLKERELTAAKAVA